MPHISQVFAATVFLSIATVTSGQVSPTSNKLEAPSLYERAAPSVVVITFVDAAGQTSQGSGVIVRSDGVIATNFHVVAEVVSARIRLANGDIYDDVSVLDTDERRDIAILKVKAINLPALVMADSDSVKIGATIYAIGAPRGLTGSLSSGIVSSLRSASEVSPTLSGFRVIQFTAPISPGSSGGPLLDESGRVLGLVFASTVGGQNLNLAIPANYVTALVANARNEGRKLKRMAEVAARAEAPVQWVLIRDDNKSAVYYDAARIQPSGANTVRLWFKFLSHDPNDPNPETVGPVEYNCKDSSLKIGGDADWSPIPRGDFTKEVCRGVSPAEDTIDSLAGTYTGPWSSNTYPVSGTVALTMTVVNGRMEAVAVFTGSEYFNQDTLIVSLAPMGSGVWKMEYRGKKTKITGTGLFRNGQFVGDYRFGKLLWVDRGKWNLQK